MQLVLQDLIFLKKCGIRIDADTFEQVRDAENVHRDFARCQHCCAISMSQHQPSCPRASILWEPLWYEMLKDQDLIYYGVLAIVRLREQFGSFE